MTIEASDDVTLACQQCLARKRAVFRAWVWDTRAPIRNDPDEPMTEWEVLEVFSAPCDHRVPVLVRADDDETLEDIGQRYGLCRERVRQIEMTALAKLRRHPKMRALGGVEDQPAPSRQSLDVRANGYRQEGPRHITQPKHRVGVVAVERRQTILDALAESAMTHAQLATLLGCSEKSVRNTTARLVVVGLVTKHVESRSGRSRGVPSVWYELASDAAE